MKRMFLIAMSAILVVIFTACSTTILTQTSDEVTTVPTETIEETTEPTTELTNPTTENTIIPPTEATTPPTTETTAPTTASTNPISPPANKPQQTKPTVTEPPATEAPKETTGTVGVYVGPADPSTGLSWDGVSPIIYTYPDGTTGTEPKEGATYESVPGITSTYVIYRDASGRAAGETCEYCGKEVEVFTHKPENRVDYCTHYKFSHYCSFCGKWVESYNCHDCIDYFDYVFYCNDCGRISGNDGSDGKCVSWLTGGNHTCPACGATVPGYTCHTCED